MPSKYSKTAGCAFCRRNREPDEFSQSHQLRDQHGKVVCPQLFKHRCELCGSTGADAHTRSYCHLARGFRAAGASEEPAEERPAQLKQQKSAPDECQLEGSLRIIGQRPFRNMSQVANSRFNSAGKLRNPNAARGGHQPQPRNSPPGGRPAKPDQLQFNQFKKHSQANQRQPFGLPPAAMSSVGSSGVRQYWPR